MLCIWFFIFYFFQLKGSDLELTIVKGSSAPQAPLNGPACTYVNIKIKVNNKEQGANGEAKKEILGKIEQMLIVGVIG